VSWVSTVFLSGSQQELGGFVEFKKSAQGISCEAQEGVSCASIVLIINNTINIDAKHVMFLKVNPPIFCWKFELREFVIVEISLFFGFWFCLVRLERDRFVSFIVVV
jgi:hypothetical protein